ncbi:MAG: HEAT repeat domain-containing protein [Thermoanaerobaculia bacterium]
MENRATSERTHAALPLHGGTRYIDSVLPSENTYRVGDLVRALSVAWRYMAAYPPDHPTLTTALAEAHTRLKELSSLSGIVNFGVTRNGLVLEDEKIESSHAQKLAEALYRRDVAVVAFDRDVEPSELDAFFRQITGDPLKASLPLWDSLAASGVSHIRITPVDFTGIRATGMDEEGFEEPESILEDIVRALMTGKQISPEGMDLREGEAMTAGGLASMLARLIDAEGVEPRAGTGPDRESTSRGSTRAADIAEALSDRVRVHLSRPADEQRRISAHQIAELIRGLPPDVRERVLLAAVRVLSSDPTAEEELRSLARVLEPDQVLRALTAVRVEGSGLSTHALRLLQSLMALSSATGEKVQGDRHDVTRLVNEISGLLSQDDIDRFNPPAHLELIAAMDIEVATVEEGDHQRALELGPERLASLEDDVILKHVRLALLEMLPARAGESEVGDIFERLEEQFLQLLGTMQLSEAIVLVDTMQSLAGDPSASEEVRKAARSSIERLATGDAIHVLIDWLHLAADDLIPQIHRIIALFGVTGMRAFLYALAEENDRSRRRRLFDFIAGMGQLIVPDAIALLSDERWYVVRNMIGLLRTVRDKRAIPEFRKLTTHSDLRVRLEAIRTLLAFDRNMTHELLEKAIEDPDPKVAETAITLCGTYGIAESRGPLARLVTRRDWFGRRRPLRLLALRALAELGRPESLEDLRPVLESRWIQVAATEERRLAYELLEFYPLAARTPWVEEGLRSRDPVIREIAHRLAPRTDTTRKEEAS